MFWGFLGREGYVLGELVEFIGVFVGFFIASRGGSSCWEYIAGRRNRFRLFLVLR